MQHYKFYGGHAALASAVVGYPVHQDLVGLLSVIHVLSNRPMQIRALHVLLDAVSVGMYAYCRHSEYWVVFSVTQYLNWTQCKTTCTAIFDWVSAFHRSCTAVLVCLSFIVVLGPN